MKILVIQGHPDNESFTHANAINYYNHVKKMGHSVEIVDLSDNKFDPVLRYGYRKHMEDESAPKEFQKKIQNADHLAFFFPIWWSSEPAILKGFIDRVLTPRFGYRYDKNSGKKIKLLKGKTASVFTSSHASSIFYKSFGNVIFRWRHLILGYCGIKLKSGFVLDNMDDKNKDTLKRRNEYMEKCVKTINDL